MDKLKRIALEVAATLAIMYLAGITPVQLPGLNLPLTFQSMFAVALPLVFTRRNAAGGVLLYLILAALGVPILAGGVGGIRYFLSDSGGYLLGFYLMSLSTTLLKKRVSEPRYLYLFAIFLFQHGLLTLLGLLWIWSIESSDITWATHVSPFLPGIIAKSFIGTILVEAWLRITSQSITYD
jgi:biotin transport system substrate-specific component